LVSERGPAGQGHSPGLHHSPEHYPHLHGALSAGLLIDKQAEAVKDPEYVGAFNIVASSLKLALRYLSGGNQQKVYLARWVDTNPSILILDEPTRGIDVNAKREIYEFIHRLAGRGISRASSSPLKWKR
jgi:ABC-type sugar transport system ATPase subunit